MYTVANIASVVVFAASALTVGWSVWNAARPHENDPHGVVHNPSPKETGIV
jgi:hypothetical protein